MTRVGLLLGAAYRSRWDEARQHGECARAAAQTCRDDGMGSFGGAFLGWVLAEMGELEAALAVGAAAVDCAPTVHFKGWATAFHDATRCRTDDAGTALPALTEATRAIEVSGHASGHALIALLLAEARVRNQRYDELLPETLALRTAALRMPYPWVAAGALGVLAERELATGAREDAAHSFQQAAREYSSIGAVDRATRASDRAMAAASGDGLGRLGHIGSGVSG
jgi:hypothetical protein